MANAKKNKKSTSRRQRIVRRLAAYSVAAGAVAVASDQAQGAIVHSDLNATVNAGGTYSFGITGSEFSISVQNFSSLHPYGSGSVGEWGARVNVFKNGDIYTGHGLDNNTTTAGQSIDNLDGGRWAGSKQVAYRKFYFSSSSSGIQKRADDNLHPTGNNNFLGLRFDAGNGDYYFGWLRLSIAKDPANDPTTVGGAASFSVTVNDFAYNNVVNEPILAGATGGGTQTPEPGTLGMLAMGALGMLAWKAWRKKDTDSLAQCG